MKVGIIGVGFVGTACAKALLLRGSCRSIVLIDTPERAAHTQGVCNDLSHGAVLCPPTQLDIGSYADLADADAVVITAGINEKAGGATNPKDPWGRLRLLPQNTQVYRTIVPRIIESGCHAPIIVVTDPPDPLADVALDVVRRLGASNPVLSSGTYLDSVRFRWQLAKRFGCSPASVDAMVLGEHGKSQVYAWSLARVGGRPVADLVAEQSAPFHAFRDEVQNAVRFANIQIINGTGASQHGIGIVTARIVEAILRDEQLVEPIGFFQDDFGLTLSFPARIGARGVAALPRPALHEEEMNALNAGAALIKKAVQIAEGDGNYDGKAP